MRFGTIVGIVLLLGIGAAWAKEAVLPSGKVRYKMTVEVNTPEGLKTGSAVREVTMGMMPNLLEPGNHAFTGSADVRGEAVVVDLGKRGALFAIMDHDGAYQVLFNAFPGPPGLTAEGIKYYTGLKNGKAALKPGKYPEFARFVTFLDLNDPKSVKAVDYRDLSKTFGSGVSTKDITVEITDEPVTEKIGSYLPWLKTRDHVMGYLGGSSIPPFIDPSQTYLNGSEFVSGE